MRIAAEERAVIRESLQKHLGGGARILIFGSRVNDHARNTGAALQRIPFSQTHEQPWSLLSRNVTHMRKGSGAPTIRRAPFSTCLLTSRRRKPSLQV